MISYFDTLVTAINPDRNYVLTSDHPSRIRIEDVTDEEIDYTALVNTVQRHTVCSTKTCLKTDTKGNIKCKYNFPKDLREKSDIVLSKRSYFELESARNDPLMNKHNKFVTMAWRGNTDWTAILSQGGFDHYISKYASKPEVRSTKFVDTLKNMLDKCPPESTMKSTVQKFLMSSLIERDYSAQEVHHLLAGN